MPRESQASDHLAWAYLRFSVVGPLLSAPPPRGQLKATIEALAEKSWRHPVTGDPLRIASSTIERWYYQARGARQDPVGVLRRRVRKDAGTNSALNQRFAAKLLDQYRTYKHWSVKLHCDNLRVLVEEDPSLRPMPSYSCVLRFMRARGLDKQRRRRDGHRPGVARADARLEQREVRSFEADYVNGLWHLDFHASSLRVLTPQGQWVYPRLLGILDDHSRLACHTQWYWNETAEDLAHGLCQALCKRGLPRALLTDNGSAMVAEEVDQGLKRLSIVHDTTLPYSPYQNGKQEVFWANVEGRLMAMLHGVDPLTLDLLNQATQAWVDLEYNRTKHSETRQKPLDRFMSGTSQGLRGSTDLHAFGDSNLYLRRGRDGLVLSMEHRAAAAPEPVGLQLITDDEAAIHLQITHDANHQQEQRRQHLAHAVLAALASSQPMTRQALRQRLAVKNQTLGEALEELERADKIERCSEGWRLLAS